MELKQAIVLRKDLDLSIGKAAAQASHASLGAYLNAGKEQQKEWLKSGQKKIVLSASSLAQLEELKKKAAAAGLPYSIISDAGYTELEPGTTTALGIGPAPEAEINKVTGSLPLL